MGRFFMGAYKKSFLAVLKFSCCFSSIHPQNRYKKSIFVGVNMLDFRDSTLSCCYTDSMIN